MNDKNKIEVFIGGSVYTLVGHESQEYMQRIALYIDKKMDELRKSDSTKKLSLNLMAVLTSLNVADDLFKQQEEFKGIKEQFEKYEIENMNQQKSIEMYKEKVDTLEEKLLENQDQQTIQRELENQVKDYKEQLLKAQEELELYKEELGKVQEENIEYEKLLDEVQLELIQYKNELNQYKHG